MHANLSLPYLNKVLSEGLGQSVKINQVQPVGGGSISKTFKLISDKKSFFLKINSGNNALEMFDAEVAGLRLLSKRSKFPIPRIISLFETEGSACLIMDFIESAPRSNSFWYDLATNLADLHKNHSANFGLAQNNFIGSLPQQNNFETTWQAFFINQRIQPMIERAVENKLLARNERLSIEAILHQITKVMPIEPPALIHGDLWSGNLMVNSQGGPSIIDPAVYYGHREMDMAFTHLFGGFSPEFYGHYQEVYPLAAGFDQRLDLYNLYPLLVHLNLFGRSYFSSIKAIIKRFT